MRVRDRRAAVLQLGAGPLQGLLLERLAATGLKPIVVDRDPHPVGLIPAALHVRASITDRDEIIRAIRPHRDALDVKAVITSIDLGVESVPGVADALGLDHATLESVSLLCDKRRAKRAFASAGISVPKGWSCSEGDPLPSVDPDREYVVKPVASSGSRGVLRATGPESIRSAIECAFEWGKEVLIEECISGVHLDVNGTVVDGRFELVSISTRFFSEAPYCIPLAGVLDVREESMRAERVASTMQKIVDATGYRHGPLKADAIDRDDEIFILEASARFHGDVLSTHAAIAQGRPPAAIHWLARIGACALGDGQAGSSAWFATFPPDAGRIEAIDGIEDFETGCSASRWIPRLSPGDRVSAPSDNRSVVGFGIAGFESGVDAAGEAARCRSMIRVRMQ